MVKLLILQCIQVTEALKYFQVSLLGNSEKTLYLYQEKHSKGEEKVFPKHQLVCQLKLKLDRRVDKRRLNPFLKINLHETTLNL